MEENENFNKINEENLPKKILLMGKTGVGKTAIKSIIFQNKTAVDTLKLCSTNEIEETHLYFINNFHINVFDCVDFSSKDDNIKQYFKNKKKFIFSNVEILIFVVQPEKNNKIEEEESQYFEK